MKILLTGSRGFLGSYLFSNLINEDLIRFDRNSKESISWDTIEGVIHCAGLAHNSHSRDLKDLYYEANVKLTKELIQYFSNSKGGYFIFISSSTVYENLSNSALIDELMTGKDLSIYAESKLLAEKELLKLKNKKVFILRPSVIVGPNPKGNIRLLEKLVGSGFPLPVPSSSSSIQLTDIRNISSVIKNLISNYDNIDSGIYNINDNGKPDFRNLLMKIAKNKGVKLKTFTLPDSLFKIALFLLGIINPTLSKKLTTLLFQPGNISNSKLSKIIPLPYNSFE